MHLAADILIAVVALLHAWFLVLEMFLWTKPLGRRVFRMSADQAAATKTLALNQGLYNGFLVAGLVWGLLAHDFHVKIFFLACVILAGLLVGTLLWSDLTDVYVWMVVLVTAGYGLLGFLDDYAKVTKQTTAGVSGRTTLVIQFAIAVLAVFLLIQFGADPR